MPTSNFTRQQQANRRLERQARRIVHRLEKFEEFHVLHAAASRVRARFETQGERLAHRWRPLAERLPAWLMNGVFVVVVLLVAAVEGRFIVVDSVSLQGQGFGTGWIGWLWVAAVGTIVYALLSYAKLHPVREATEAHVAAVTDEEHRRTRSAWRKAWLATLAYLTVVIFISALSWNYEQTGKLSRERLQEEIQNIRKQTMESNAFLVAPTVSATEPKLDARTTVVAGPEQSLWSRALEGTAGFLFGGVRPWILAGHFLLLLWPLNLTWLAEPVSYEQALDREEKLGRAEAKASRTVRPLVAAAYEQSKAGDAQLYELIRNSLKPGTLELLEKLHHQPAETVAPAVPAPERPSSTAQNGAPPEARPESNPAQNDPRPESPADPFEGLA